MMLDSQADIGRRVWLPCRYCSNNTALYLLASDVILVWVLWGKCLRRWWHYTGVGKGGRPIDLDDVA